MASSNFTIPASSNETLTQTVSGFPFISDIIFNRNSAGTTFSNPLTTIGSNSSASYRQFRSRGNFIRVDNIYLSAADSTMFGLSTVYVNYFSEASLTKKRYTPSSIARLSALYPSFSGAIIPSFTVYSNMKNVDFSIPSLSSFTTEQNFNVIFLNPSGYSVYTITITP